MQSVSDLEKPRFELAAKGVNRVKLFNMLINKGLPGRLVKIIIDW